MSEDVETLKKEVKRLNDEINDIKKRCVLKEESPIETTMTIQSSSEEEASEDESATEPATSEEETAGSDTEEPTG